MRRLLVLFAWAGVLGASAGDLPFETGTVFGKAVRLAGADAVKAAAVECVGDRLYLGGPGFLAVYDVAADPLHPVPLGRTDDISGVRQFAVQDGFVYAVARENGLWIVDCRDPRAPRTRGHLPSTSNCTGVDVCGNVCFIGGSRSGIDFVDVSDPARPRLIANRRIQPAESQSVAYRDGILYSGEWNGKAVTVWDCRDLARISRIAVAPLASNGDGVWPQGRWLYANTGWTPEDKKRTAPRPNQMGLEVFDIADPAKPVRTGRVDFAYCAPEGVDMWLGRASGDRVFCAQNLGGLYAVDVADKSAPKVLDRWCWTKAKGSARAAALEKGHASARVGSLALGDGVVYVAGQGLGAWAVPAQGARPAKVEKGAPPKNAQLRPPRPEAPVDCVRWLPSDPALQAVVTGVAVRGDTCYAAAGTAGLFVLELSAEGVRERSRIPLAECMDASVAGDRLFVSAGRAGFIGYDIGPDGILREFLRQPSKGARDVYAFGDGRRWAGFNSTVYDIADPARPKALVGLVHQSRWSRFLCPDLLGGRWAMGNSALHHVGFADLAAPEVREMKLAGYKPRYGGICALGDRALLVDAGKWALLELGRDDPPRLRDFPGGPVSGIPRAEGDVVAVSAGGNVSVWDFSDREKPVRLAAFKFPGSCETVAFWNRRLVIPALETGLLLSRSW